MFPDSFRQYRDQVRVGHKTERLIKEMGPDTHHEPLPSSVQHLLHISVSVPEGETKKYRQFHFTHKEKYPSTLLILSRYSYCIQLVHIFGVLYSNLNSLCSMLHITYRMSITQDDSVSWCFRNCHCSRWTLFNSSRFASLREMTVTEAVLYHTLYIAKVIDPSTLREETNQTNSI